MIKKWARPLCKEDIQMANRHKKSARHGGSPGKCKSKPQRPFTPIRIAVIKKARDESCWQG